jgi:hypothetical protein
MGEEDFGSEDICTTFSLYFSQYNDSVRVAVRDFQNRIPATPVMSVSPALKASARAAYRNLFRAASATFRGKGFDNMFAAFWSYMEFIRR